MELTDLELIKKIQNKEEENESLISLIERHKKLFYSIIDRRIKPNKKFPQHIIDEVIDSIGLVFYRAAINYDESRNMKFSTYLGQWCFWFSQKTFQKYECKIKFNPQYHEVLKRKIVSNSEYSNPNIDEDDLIEEIKKIIKNLKNEEAKKILSLRYLECKEKKLTTWVKIGEQMNMPPKACLYIHNKALKNIRDVLKKNLINVEFNK